MSLSPSQRSTLETEIQTDPLGRGYAGLTDAQVLADLYTVYRERNVRTLTGDQIFTSTHPPDFVALSAQAQALWMSFCGRNTIDAFATANGDFVQWIIGTASQTVANLVDLRTEDITRAEELGLPDNMTVHQIQEART